MGWFFYSQPAFVFSFYCLLFSYCLWVDWARRREYNQLIRQNRQLHYVDQLAQALRQNMNLSEVVQLIISNLVNELDYDRVILYSYVVQKKGHDFLQPLAVYGIEMNLIKDYTFKLDKRLDILPRAVMEKTPFIISRASEDYRCDQKFVSLISLKEYAVVPILVKNHPLGVLLADRQETQKPILKEDIPVLTIFANQAGIAIENARLYTQVEELATIDGLTNLYNRRYFQEVFQLELQRMERYPEQDRMLAVMMMDVDHFKIYNDTYGHQAGDQVLLEIGHILKNTLRKVDLIARYGGEEFIVVLPVTSKENGVMLAERLRQAVEKYPFEFGEKLPLRHVTLSMGVAGYGEEDGTNAEELIKTSDCRLYQAKHKGRNCVCSASENIAGAVAEKKEDETGVKKTAINF